MNGIIRKLVRDKSYGFIRYGKNQSIFFHYSHVTDPLGFGVFAKSMWVSFEFSTNHKGEPMAVDVKRKILNDEEKALWRRQ